jgi:hypothetical protein
LPNRFDLPGHRRVHLGFHRHRSSIIQQENKGEKIMADIIGSIVRLPETAVNLVVAGIGIIVIAIIALIFPSIGALFLGVGLAIGAILMKDAQFIQREGFSMTFGVFLGILSLAFIGMWYLSIDPLSLSGAVIGPSMTSSIGGTGGLVSTVTPASIVTLAIVGGLLFAGLIIVPMVIKKKRGARR